MATNAILYCPKCRADLTGDPIPADIREHYDGTYWERQIGLSDGDSVYAYQCPDCGYEWLLSEAHRDRAEADGWFPPVMH
jgi:predicted RNA-binding Zn-ribbon protein involved in translation (DUF1610 family)